jgi:hypothetical protein
MAPGKGNIVSTSYDERKKLHYDLLNVELRAQATAVGMVQICIELRRANVLDESAIERIKNAIADEVSLNAPRSIGIQDYRHDIKNRLDRLFAGEQQVGPADAMSFNTGG